MPAGRPKSLSVGSSLPRGFAGQRLLNYAPGAMQPGHTAGGQAGQGFAAWPMAMAQPQFQSEVGHHHGFPAADDAAAGNATHDES